MPREWFNLISFFKRKPASSLVKGGRDVRVVVLVFSDLLYRGPVQIFIPYYRVARVALCFDVGGNYLSLWRE